MIIIDDYKKIAADAKAQIGDLKDAVSYNQILMEIEKLEVDTQNPAFWENPESKHKPFSLSTMGMVSLRPHKFQKIRRGMV